MRLKAPIGTSEFLNVNSPLQVGGSLSNLMKLGDKFKWQHTPTTKGFVGCIRNLTLNGNVSINCFQLKFFKTYLEETNYKIPTFICTLLSGTKTPVKYLFSSACSLISQTYNLGMPSLSVNADPGCSTGMAKAVSFGIDTNFLVAILVCITILLILLLAVVVHRRKTDDLYKDMDDIRENIINYEDEGGGEVDTGYDLNVLRAMYDPPNDMKINAASLQGRGNSIYFVTAPAVQSTRKS